MGLNIAVCIKPVPDPNYYDKITIDPTSKTINREGIPTVINPVDKNAIEAALQLREEFGGTVIAISMAPPNGEEKLREALAMGVDHGYLLTDRAFAGADTWATSYSLSKGLKKTGDFDLIFTGTESADGATTQVPAQLAQWLGIPHIWNAKEFKIDGDKLNTKMKIENGYIEYEMQLPALLAVSRECNKPRYTTIMGVMKAKKKPISIFTADDIDVNKDWIGLCGSPTQPGEIFTPSLERKGLELKGEAGEIVSQLLKRLRAAGINLEAWDSCQVRGE